nr:uncharacterized protein LOC124811439 [Hydra vulgaris]
METRKIRKRKHSFIYESEVADDEVEDNFQESETGNTNICSITKPTPPDHLMAIQSSSGLHMSKYLNNPHSNTSDSQPGILHPGVLSNQSKTIMETPVHVLSSINSCKLVF